jgi:LPS export ABC transporter permease LptG
VGVLVIFAYYIVMYLAESQTKGFYRTIEEARGLGAASFLNAHLSRWWPNLVLGAFGLAALIWRARHTDGRLPFNLTRRLAPHAARWRARLPLQAAASRAAGGRPPNVRVVVRIPRLRLPAPGLLDRYIGRTYLRVIGISFFALLGLFYISTFIDRSDKIFKGDAPAALVATLILYMTPKFIYYIIPIATLLAALVTFGLLARTSELTVMKACGISLYRASLSVVLLSLVFSSAIFGLEQRLLARANRQAEIVDAKIKGRQPRVFNPSDQRWLVGSDGAIYHYAIFDPDRLQLSGLTLYQPTADRWALATATRAERAVYRDGGWTAVNAWTQDFRREASRPAVFSEQRLPALEPPDYFKAEQPVAEMMTVGELKRYLTRLAESGLNVMPLEVDLQHKLAFPFVTLVMTLLAVPFGVSTGRRGTLYGIGLAIVIALSYWILMSVFVALGKGGLLAPWLAAWAPNVIVLGSALYLFLTVRT